jgi:hypothetical protein
MHPVHSHSGAEIIATVRSIFAYAGGRFEQFALASDCDLFMKSSFNRITPVAPEQDLECRNRYAVTISPDRKTSLGRAALVFKKT